MQERLRKTSVLIIGAKNLPSDKSSEEIARSILDLATSIKNEKHDVSISNIIIRAGDKNLEEKKLCKEKI